AAWLAFYLRQWGRVWTRGEWTPFRFAQVGAGIALLLLMLHGLTDFNLRIPANAVFAAFLAAVFFHRGAVEKRRPVRRRESPEGDDGSDKSRPPPPSFPPIPRENQVNPFAS
ncbi:MAG: O-antigen ligase domain-containing protein, partial [Candidatus Competibacter sp.]|nr:O-antigen ligase domain-containing protein [Candidatus Competibacter sp.]